MSIIWQIRRQTIPTWTEIKIIQVEGLKSLKHDNLLNTIIQNLI